MAVLATRRNNQQKNDTQPNRPDHRINVNSIKAHRRYLVGTMGKGPLTTITNDLNTIRCLPLETCGQLSIGEVRQVVDDVFGDCLFCA